MYQSTPVTGGIFGLASGTLQGRSLFINGRFSILAYLLPPKFYSKLLAAVAEHLHLHGCLMYPYVDDIFHAQASANQAARTCDCSLCCYFMLGFIINLQKSSLVPSQLMLHLGALIDTARGLVFSSLVRTEMIVVGSHAGLSSTLLSGDRATGILPCSGAPVHVLSSSFVYSPERSLRHEGVSPYQADPLVVSSDLVNSGILVSPETCVPGSPSDTSGYAVFGVEQSVFSPYQLAQAGDCFPHLEEIPEVAVWHTHPGSDR